MPPATDELLTAVPTREALDASHLQAMRGMSDHIASMGRSVEALAKDLRETRDAVLELKAQDLKSTIVAVRGEALATVQRLREDHDKDIAKLRSDFDADIKEVDDKTDANARSISRIQGIFLPLGVIGAGILAFLGELAANLAVLGRHP